ncbi:MAG: Penicillin-binding protein 2 [Candidatus Woesebacteria bacterium GW2011_GWB1_43_14]|uniref:Penicillin-binding protein 2 n=1 Tax=Candidatus Woesebacteria bacterium GW2011_GWB1_43_14 TaxID=1618578 RepID=A0A0G1DH72_9BACT|nr:MAG: Penicillin-binding protein 2 [Candidatus Woesebacteria bacterium GW2011_GWA1_39_11b]KKS77750.1 MAG: peptidoglycan glycosyltransferase, penicillin-binding protein 2 [Candidatus Woesebacteria bacterium GW2011_GWC1_42_9]KKS96942.1 MAG: Penicillin-binding protein 2 [Candidatus Woesebacteria bacterium GW2011_GWB1_43_14]
MESLTASQKQSWLSWFFRGILVLASIALTARLIELQIVKGEYYATLAQENRIRKVPIRAPRGEILGRSGEAIVGNQEIKKIVEFLPEAGLVKKEVGGDYQGDEAIVEHKRKYYNGSSFAHITGYVGEINETEVGKVNPDCVEKGEYKLSDLIGRSGLEGYYECLLRGIDGEELVEVNTRGEKIRTLGRKPVIPGEDIKTTIDSELQKKVSGLLHGEKGVIIVSGPEGEILAFYSSPSFDPEIVVDSLDDPNLPIFNRAIGGTFHPGSIFKIVTAIAALEDGKINREFTYEDTGAINVKEFEYTNWYFTQYGAVEGVIGLVKAIARSTDTFFYKVGEFIGAERLAFWADKFGLSQTTGVDLPGEVSGLVPTPEWKKRVKGENWFLGNTYHMSIGQGDLAITPIEANVMTMVIANGGALCQPFFVGDHSECRNLDISEDSIQMVKEGMIAACSIGGTAYPFFGFYPQVACKTGTAETFNEEKTHAWFIAFAPEDFPEIVVTVLVEEGGEGSKVAAPIAYEIFDYWFTR